MELVVLVCDDDPIVHESLRLYLQKEGMKMHSAFNGSDGLKLVNELKPDIAIVDVMMPVMSGLEMCREVRKFSKMPIIMLTAKGEEIDRILGLELGADDYIVKPFSPREVIARIKAILRRVEEINDYRALADNGKFEQVPGLEIDIKSLDVKLNGIEAHFTKKEAELLYFLARYPNVTFSREQILEKIWGYESVGQSRTVDTHIKQLRKKLSDYDLPWALETVHGVGYRLKLANA